MNILAFELKIRELLNSAVVISLKEKQERERTKIYGR